MKERKFLHNRNEMISDEFDNKLLDEILKTDNMLSLPDDFADRVAMKAIQRMTLKQSLRELLIYTGVVSGIFIAFLSILYLSNNENVKKWVDFLLTNMALLFGITLILFFILFIDRVILPQSFLMRKEKSII
jgi:hypothetical protein